MLTEKDYCDYETCVALKELGYNGTTGECSHFGAFHMNGKEIFYDRLYNSELKEDECLRVPLYLAQKWLREEKDIDVLIKLECKDVYSSLKHYSVYLSYIGSFIRRFQYLLDEFNSYEEALFEGIKIAVKILKEK